MNLEYGIDTTMLKSNPNVIISANPTAGLVWYGSSLYGRYSTTMRPYISVWSDGMSSFFIKYIVPVPFAHPPIIYDKFPISFANDLAHSYRISLFACLDGCQY